MSGRSASAAQLVKRHDNSGQMGYPSWAMKMAFKKMYFRTGGKPASWGMPATEFTMDRLPLP